ncbi:hypothetical protein WDU94_009055 [Cyamophila willieti]
MQLSVHFSVPSRIQPSDTSYRVPIILLCSALARSQLGTVRHEHLEGIARGSLSGAVTLLSLRLGGSTVAV